MQKNKVRQGVLAHVYAQSVTVLTQFASVPLMISHWGLELYSLWILVSAFPLYMSFFDVGLTTVVGNKVTMARANGNIDKANHLTDELNGVFLILIPALLFLCCLPAFGFIWIGEKYLIALSLLCALAVLQIWCGVFDVIYRSRGKYPKVTMYLTTTRLVEWVFAMVAILLGGDLIYAASGYCVGRLICIVCICVAIKKDCPDHKWKFGIPSKKSAMQLIGEGLPFMVFPMGAIFSVQGVILVCGYFFAPKEIAILATYRTLTRTITQVSLVASKSITPELSRLWGGGAEDEAKEVLKNISSKVLKIKSWASVILLIISWPLIEIWGGNQIPVNFTILILLLFAAFASGFWQLKCSLVLAINRHQYLARRYLVVSLGLFIFTFIVAPFFGIYGVAFLLLAVEIYMLYVVNNSFSPVE